MNVDTKHCWLDQAERAVQRTSGGRRESETSFLQCLLREFGSPVSAPGLSPAELFRAVLYDRPVTDDARDVLEVLAMPSQRPESPLRSGDLMLRAVPGTGDVGHVAVLASDDLLTQPMLAPEGIASESAQPGHYGLVIEAGAFPHSRSRPFARRWLDYRGRVPPHTVVLRPKYSDLEAMADLLEDEDADSYASPATGWSSGPTAEEAEDFTGADYGEDELELLHGQPFEQHFDPSAIAPDIADALGKKDWPLALKLAIQAGSRDENELTNLIFFARHPELPPKKLDPKDPNFRRLSSEWSRIQEREVWRAIEASAENTDLVVSGEEVTDHHRRFFRGKSGTRLKTLVEKAAREVGLNPGLLGTVMMAETGRPQSYLSSEKVSSYHIGADDFFEARAAIKARVPAYARVKWDKKQKPLEHLNDAKTNRRMVKTILFDSGPDAVLATAVYVKFREVRLREIAAEFGGDFDSLPLATQMALTRMAMAAGTGGATRFLKEALKGGDIFVRKAIPVAAYQTQRNATVRTAQAMHLSDWVFGIPVPAATAQPGPEALENLDDSGFALESLANLTLGEATPRLCSDDQIARRFGVSQGNGRNELQGFDRHFAGQQGLRFRELIIRAANEMRLDSALLAINALTEVDSAAPFLARRRTDNAHVGLDYWHTQRGRVRREHGKMFINRMITNRMYPHCTIIPGDPHCHFINEQGVDTGPMHMFASGFEALRAMGAWLAVKQNDLVEAMEGLFGWVGLPKSIQWLLVRLTYNPGSHDPKALARRALAEINAGRDPLAIFPVAGPVGPSHPLRTAVLRSAQALHLANQIFGQRIPCP